MSAPGVTRGLYNTMMRKEPTVCLHFYKYTSQLLKCYNHICFVFLNVIFSLDKYRELDDGGYEQDLIMSLFYKVIKVK